MINRENLIKIGRAGGNTSNRETPDQIGRVGMSAFIIQAQVVQKVDSAINSYQGDNAIASYYLSVG